MIHLMSTSMILNDDEHKKGWTDAPYQLSLKDRVWIELQKLNPLNWYWVYEVATGIQNLFRYVKIVYRDRDYDYEYLYVLLRFKLTNIRNHLNDHRSFVGVEEEVERLDQVISA